MRVHPHSWWWIKADGCDIVSGISESVSGEWSGDVNMKQGALDSAYKKYKDRLQWVMGVGLEARKEDLLEDLDTISRQVTYDIEYTATSKFLSELPIVFATQLFIHSPSAY